MTSDLQIKSLGKKFMDLASMLSNKKLKRENALTSIKIDAKKILVSEQEEKGFWDGYIELKRETGPVDFGYVPYDFKKYIIW